MLSPQSDASSTPPWLRSVAVSSVERPYHAGWSPRCRVARILQDRRGYLWFGTRAGLTRYDGAEFLNFGPAHELPGIFGRSIMEDHVGAIWFSYSGFRERGIMRLWNGREDHFDQRQGLRGSQVIQVPEDIRGDVWAATDAGLERIKFSDSARTSWSVDSPIDSAVLAIPADPRGGLYYATTKGL